MQFTEAVALAARISADVPRMQVMAIGRFVCVEELRPDSPWYVSVYEPGMERPRVLRSESDVPEFAPPPPAPPSKPVANKRRALAAATPMLFD